MQLLFLEIHLEMKEKKNELIKTINENIKK